MKRREFLRRSGAAVAGGAAVWTAPGGVCSAADSEAGRSVVLFTGAENELPRQIAGALTAHYGVRLTSTQPLSSDLPFSLCSLETEDQAAQLLQGAWSVVHWGSAPSAEQERGHVGSGSQRTYHLLQGAVAAGVRRLVYLSSLDLVDSFSPEYLVDEDFGPRVMPGVGLLPLYLDEFCCREFARGGRLQVVVLRLAPVRRSDSSTPAESGAARLGLQDAIQAVRLALETESISDGRGINTWSVFHILSHPRDGRFSISRAQRILRFEPRG
jgi:nucleoside-diphosphate-sugar epimerase